MTEFATVTQNTLSEQQLFTLNFTFKLFHVSVAIANIGSLRYFLQLLDKYFHHKLMKFRLKSNDQNYTKFESFRQKKMFAMLIIFNISLALWKKFL